MKTETIEIVDRGRGPQLSTTRITVSDVFYWIHRGHGWEEIPDLLPTLSREEIDVVKDYVVQHHDALVEEDRLAEERIERRMGEQRARGGIFAGPDPSLTKEQRMELLREKLRKFIARKNGEGHPG